ncbi:MAG: 50S ribosomal protein L23 [Bacilli bacterium]
MNNYRDIIKAPIVTEKNATLATNEGKYVFEVARSANKTSIKQAIESIFKVKVENINIINVKPKNKKVGLHKGKTNHVKKAIVKLAEGNKIDFS